MVRFSGIGSGIDFDAITNGLVAARRAPVQQLELNKGVANLEIQRVGELNTLLEALKTEAEKLDAPDDARSVSVSSSNEAVMTVTGDGSAVVGSRQIRVDALAASSVDASSGFATNTAGVAGAGTLDITVGSDAVVQFAYDNTMSLSDIAAGINATSARVKASVLFDGTNHRLLIQGSESGLANAVSLADSGGLGITNLQPAADAQLTVDGLAVTRPSNQISDLIPGATIDLLGTQAPTDAPVQIDVRNDAEGLEEKLQGFVDAYNAVIRFTNTQLTPGETSSSPLQGDTTLRGLQGRLSGIVSSPYTNGSVTASLGSIGLEIGDDGSIKIDSAKLSAIQAADPQTIDNIFAGDGTTSLTAGFKTLIDEYTKSSTGILAVKQEGVQDRISDYDRTIERIEASADRLEEQLRRQFSALDAALAEMNGQLGALTALFPPAQQ